MIFIENKYASVYFSIVERSKNRNISGYTEKHHIIPKSLGGTNDKSNLVVLTAREHYLCHILLVKMTNGVNKIKMIHAAAAFNNWTSNNHKRSVRINSRIFQNLKELRQQVLRHEMAKPENKKKSSDGAKQLWANSNYKQKASAKRKLLWKDSDYLNKMKDRTRTFKRVNINGVEYFSLKEAATQLMIDPSTVSKRCSSQDEKFINWNYI
jgi:hypothetical protein